MSGFKNVAEEDDNSPAALFRRFKKSVDSAVRPVPGIIKSITKAAIGEDETNPSSGEKLSNNGVISPEFSIRQTTITATGTKSTSKVAPYKLAQFEQLLHQNENVDMELLRKLSWNGVPSQYRPEVWQILLGYMPSNRDRRESAIIRKRKEYLDSIPLYFDISDQDRTKQDEEIMTQILKDLPRSNPNHPFFSQKPIQNAMLRILYIWSIRHPASGYVQGMDDLLTPLFLISTQPFVPDPLLCDAALLDSTILKNIEADAYWCLTKLLDNIQDHYTFSQPGLQRMILRLEDLIIRLDKELHDHFQAEGIQYIQFGFRWMNCVLRRELPLKAILRVWDTYFSEVHGGFENFHVYVCAVLLKTYKEVLMSMQFQEILMFLQDLPTADWGEEQVEPILSQAYILSTLFENSPSHFN
eukprot:gene6443-8864_t